MKLLFAAIVSLTVVSSAISEPLWVNTWDSAAYDSVETIKSAAYNDPYSSNLFVSALGYSSTDGRDWILINFNTDGVVQWTGAYPDPIPGDSHPIDLALEITNWKVTAIYVVGTTGSGSGTDYLLVKFDSLGNVQWQRTYDGPAHGADIAAALMTFQSSGYLPSVVMTGTSEGIGTGRDIATVCFDQNGLFKWEKRFDGPGSGDDHAADVCLSSSSADMLVTGSVWSLGGATQSDIVTIDYSRDGAEVWSRYYDGPMHGEDSAVAIFVNSGKEWVVGSSQGTDSSLDYVMVGYTWDGADVWTGRYSNDSGGRRHDDIPAAAEMGIITGVSRNLTGDTSSFATVAFSGTDGSVTWVKKYGVPAECRPAAITTDRNYVYAAGSIAATLSPEQATMLMYCRAYTLSWTERTESLVAASITESNIKSLHVVGGRDIIAAGTGRYSGKKFVLLIKYDGPCCQGYVGNVDGTGISDLYDLSALVNYLTGGGFVIPCPDEANVNRWGIIDLSDLSTFVAYLTGGGWVLPNCP